MGRALIVDTTGPDESYLAEFLWIKAMKYTESSAGLLFVISTASIISTIIHMLKIAASHCVMESCPIPQT